MAKKKTTPKKSKLEQAKKTIELAQSLSKATISLFDTDYMEADLTTLNPAKVEEVENEFIENLLEVFNQFYSKKEKTNLKVMFKNNAEAWKELRWFMSLIYTWDVTDRFNNFDYYETDVYYQTIGGEMEFIAECKGNKLILTVTKF